MTFKKAVKSLLSLRAPDDKVVRATLPFGYLITSIEIERPVSQNRKNLCFLCCAWM